MCVLLFFLFLLFSNAYVIKTVFDSITFPLVATVMRGDLSELTTVNNAIK